MRPRLTVRYPLKFVTPPQHKQIDDLGPLIKMKKNHRNRKSSYPGRPTIRDVAVDAGVSTASVSRALSKKEDISPDLYERITASINKLGYVPNRAAKTLSQTYTDTIDIISMLCDEIGGPLVHALVRIFGAKGYTPFVHIPSNKIENDALRQKKLVDGLGQISVILIPSVFNFANDILDSAKAEVIFIHSYADLDIISEVSRLISITNSERLFIIIDIN